MSNQSPTEFSFDLYPGLDSELDDAYRRNIEGGIAPPNDAVSGLASVIGNIIQSPNQIGFSQEVSDWAVDEFEYAFHQWIRFHSEDLVYMPEDIIGPIHNMLDGTDDAPMNVTDIEKWLGNNAGETVTFLHEAKQKFIALDEIKTPEGNEIGPTMNLVLLPWQAFRNHLHDLTPWVHMLREQQGIDTTDYFNSDLLKAITEDKPMYRDPRDVSKLLSAREYLDLRIEYDGPWGIMLAQTSDEAGTKDLVDGDAEFRTPDSLTNKGQSRTTMGNGIPIDNLGIFEWLAMTFQEDPSELSSQDFSWLLANRLTLDSGDPYVPGGDFDGGQVGSDLVGAGNGDSDIRPRLAVMKTLELRT
jgi:hypothetical protein